jgi:hypothetical protein
MLLIGHHGAVIFHSATMDFHQELNEQFVSLDVDRWGAQFLLFLLGDHDMRQPWHDHDIANKFVWT